jgi:hypothetical protein
MKWSMRKEPLLHYFRCGNLIFMVLTHNSMVLMHVTFAIEQYRSSF